MECDFSPSLSYQEFSVANVPDADIEVNCKNAGLHLANGLKNDSPTTGKNALFYLGVHLPNFLSMTNVPLFVSRRRLRSKRLPRARGIWALDSGGFSELSLFGQWTVGYKQYISEVRRYSDEIGGLQWAAQQDWMCEPFILKNTGLTVLDHQCNTVENYLDLMNAAPELPWVPVIQGFEPHEYDNHIEHYARCGVDLRTLSTVGIGSVCRRQGTNQIADLIKRVSGYGINLHGFGVKTAGLAKVKTFLKSADSMAWSYVARREGIRLEGHKHKNCANCLEYALLWRNNLVQTVSLQ